MGENTRSMHGIFCLCVNKKLISKLYFITINQKSLTTSKQSCNSLTGYILPGPGRYHAKNVKQKSHGFMFHCMVDVAAIQKIGTNYKNRNNILQNRIM